MLKRCNTCETEKPHEDFRSRKGVPDGLDYMCRVCRNEYMRKWAKKKWDSDPEYRNKRRDYHREWYASHPEEARRREERMRSYKRQWKHGVTVEDYDRMATEQGGGCAICGGQPSRTKYLHVDHDHATGEIRGLLCDACNLGLGKFRDDPTIIANAIAYLRAAAEAAPRKAD